MTLSEGHAPTLGEILSAARRQSGAFAAWLEKGNPAVHARLNLRLEPGDTLASLTRVAVSDFTHEASDEDWVKLISAARDAEDPGLAALTVMIGWYTRGATA